MCGLPILSNDASQVGFDAGKLYLSRFVFLPPGENQVNTKLANCIVMRRAGVMNFNSCLMFLRFFLTLSR